MAATSAQQQCLGKAISRSVDWVPTSQVAVAHLLLLRRMSSTVR